MENFVSLLIPYLPLCLVAGLIAGCFLRVFRIKVRIFLLVFTGIGVLAAAYFLALLISLDVPHAVEPAGGFLSFILMVDLGLVLGWRFSPFPRQIA